MNQHPTDTKASQSGTAALRFDVVAGLTAAAVVLPKAMAYATVAGLPVAVGLDTAFIPMVVYALLGSSRAEGIQLLVVRPKLYMRRYGESTGIRLRTGRENVFPSVRAAVEAMLVREGRSPRRAEAPKGCSAE